jgi:hypothetical protein
MNVSSLKLRCQMTYLSFPHDMSLFIMNRSSSEGKVIPSGPKLEVCSSEKQSKALFDLWRKKIHASRHQTAVDGRKTSQQNYGRSAPVFPFELLSLPATRVNGRAERPFADTGSNEINEEACSEKSGGQMSQRRLSNVAGDNLFCRLM